MRSLPVPLAAPADPEGAPLSRGTTVGPEGYVGELEHELLLGLARLGDQARSAIQAEVPATDLLASALRDQIETAEVGALWLSDEPDLDLRLGLARLVGDQARHFELVTLRIRELGGDATAVPRVRVHGPLFRYLRGLQTPAERLAAGLAREAVARLRSGLIAEICEARGDLATARLCRDAIGPDELRHLEFFRNELPRYAHTLQDQEAGRRSLARVVQLAEEAGEPSRSTKSQAPSAEPAPPGR